MEKEGFEGIEPIEDVDPFNVALEHFDACKKFFSDSAENWVKSPNEKSESDFTKADELIKKAFNNVTALIVNDYSTGIPERAYMIAGLLQDSDTSRVETLNNIAPAGNFVEPTKTLEKVAEELEEDFVNEYGNGEERDVITGKIMKRFADDHDHDIEWLKINIKKQQNKPKFVSDGLKRQMLEFGKLTAAATLGGLITHYLIKSNSEQI